MPTNLCFCHLLHSEHGEFISAAANRFKPLDERICWTDDARQQNNEYVINLNRFLIRPSVRCQDLASKANSISLKAKAKDSLEEYQIAPCLAETFVASKEKESHYLGQEHLENGIAIMAEKPWLVGRRAACYISSMNTEMKNHGSCAL